MAGMLDVATAAAAAAVAVATVVFVVEELPPVLIHTACGALQVVSFATGSQQHGGYGKVGAREAA